MSYPSSRSRSRALVAMCAFGLVAAPLTLVAPAQANPLGTNVVISEVYGGGGNSGASHNQDFVELYNPTSAAIDLGDWSVQYRSATGSANPSGVIALTGSIPANGHYLVGAAKGTTGEALPTPNATGTDVNLSGTNGTVFLSNQATALTTPATGGTNSNPAILDLVGFGTSNTFETAPVTGLNNAASAQRSPIGADTDNNSADLTAGSPTPENAGDVPPPPPPPEPEEPTPATIEEIQGTGATTPLAGERVITTGVVTAAYKTGGFNGFYIQTPGTGGAVDPDSHPASNAVFVYGSDAVSEVAIGNHVAVTGTAGEFYGLTQVSDVTDVAVLDTSAAKVQPAAVTYPRTDASRESLEGMLIAPHQGDYVVADNYTLNQYAEIGLASGTTPLHQPTDVALPGSPEATAVAADNAARKVTLDDGSSLNYLTTGKNQPLPYLTVANPIRVGAAVTFDQPVVLDYRNSAWKFQPTEQLTADRTSPATFKNTRTAHPESVGGDIQIASFNVLNYFPTTGADWVASGGTCSYYYDRTGTDPVTDNRCSDDGPRGAAEDEDLDRQQVKIVKAINALDAEIVTLEEIENSIHYGNDRDAAVARLVDALNKDAGSDTWTFAPTPSDAGDQMTEDVIRTAFIYKKADVRTVGKSKILQDAAFENARDPLAQAFRGTGSAAGSKFAVIVNHFKSKGSGGAGDGDEGQGASNKARTAQAEALVAFAREVKRDLGSKKVFLTGDFNAYTQEDPMRVLYDAGYTDLESEFADEEYTYLFSGLVGSLDHVLASRTALKTVTDADVWNINSVESVALEYSRHNYNATDFYTADPYRSSDHDPLVAGVKLAQRKAEPSIKVNVFPKKVRVDRTRPRVKVVVKAAGQVVTGRVKIYRFGKVLDGAKLVDGKAKLKLHAFRVTGKKVLTVKYLGSSTVENAKQRFHIRVVR